MASLNLEHLSCDYQTGRGTIRAVDDLCLDVADRELVVLVGPSGCGKTTTLRLIAGLESPSDGCIRIGNRMVNNVPPRGRDVAMVFQNFALYPHMTVYENMAFGLRMQSVRKAEIVQTVEQFAARLGLTPLLDRRPHQLSGGERQRVALGRAIVCKPQVFLLDEPLSNLDLSLRTAMRSEIKRLQRELTTTMIYVTHDQEEAMTLADRIGVLNHGRLQQFAPPLEIYQRPANRFVAGFFGSPPMNLIHGTVQTNGTGAEFRCGALRIEGLRQTGWMQAASPREVVLGIRPHDVNLIMVGGLQAVGGMNPHRGIVRDVEPLGDATVLRTVLENGVEFVAKSSASDAPTIGATVEIGFQPDKLHFFDADKTGRRLN